MLLDIFEPTTWYEAAALAFFLLFMVFLAMVPFIAIIVRCTTFQDIFIEKEIRKDEQTKSNHHQN
jgi:uncharacterized BrkB/YihY/UPF0761 family membrane protein